MPSSPMTMRVRRGRSAAPSFTLTAQTPGGGACRRTASWSGRVRRLFNRGRCTRSATWARSRSARQTRTGERRREERRTPRPPTPPCPAVSIFGWGLGEPRGSATPARARRSGGMPRGVGGRQLAPRSARENGQGAGRGSGPSRHREIRGWRMSNGGLVLGADTLVHVAGRAAFPGGPTGADAAGVGRGRSLPRGGVRDRHTSDALAYRRVVRATCFEGVWAASTAWDRGRAAVPAFAWAGPGGHHGLVRGRQGCAEGVERGESGRAGVRLGGGVDMTATSTGIFGRRPSTCRRRRRRRTGLEEEQQVQRLLL